MSKKVSTTPWLHWNTEFNDGWDDSDDNMWLTLYTKTNNPVFHIPKDVSEIRFVVKSRADEGYSYRIANADAYWSVDLKASDGKIYNWSDGLQGELLEFLRNNIGKHLILEYR